MSIWSTMIIPYSSALITSGLLLASLAADAGANPNPQPKSSWVRKGRGGRPVSRSLQNQHASCVESNATKITAPYTNVWEELSNDEAAGVVKWLFQQPDLNLTTSDDAGEWDNTIQLVELMRPNKTDVLQYLDHSGPAPTRYAHAVIVHRASVDPYYADVLVGPLPIKNGTTSWQPLEYPYTRKTGGRVRTLDADSDTQQQFLYNISSSIVDITLDLFNGTALGLDNDSLDIWGIDPFWQDDGRVVRWDGFWSLPTDDFDMETLLPLGLYIKSDVTGRDPSKWKHEGWLYNDVYYSTTEEFRRAYFSPGFIKLGANAEGAWGGTDRQGPELARDANYPPVTVAPSGARYSVDEERKYISWMDFSFYVGFSRDLGVSLYDIRYKGQRVLYELGLQEALAHYAGETAPHAPKDPSRTGMDAANKSSGNDPVQSGTSYLDSYYGFGPYAFQLVKGYDCPSYATYLNSSFYVSETTHTHIDSICLFEYDADFPIQRHSSSWYVSNTKNVYFTLRSVSTVGNYDYMFRYLNDQ